MSDLLSRLDRHQLVIHAETLASRLAQAEAEVERLKGDARRYQWLRANFLRDVQHRLTWYLPWNCPMTAEGLDRNIDAAHLAASSAENVKDTGEKSDE